MAAFWHTIVIAEDLVFRDVNRCSKDLGVLSSEQHPRYLCHSICRPVTSRTVLEGKTAELREELLVNTISEVVENNYSYGGVPIFFQG
jgi:hypothetical protein